MKIRFFAFLSLIALLLGAARASPPREIDWTELMPPDELKALQDMASNVDHTGGMAQDLFNSERTVAKMDGARGKLAGYVVPITTNDNNQMVDFFLVPYFGACIHIPPPPPNQILYVKPKTPLPMGEIWDAFWAIGTLKVAKTHNDMATAVYSMQLDRLEVIKE